MRSTGHTTTQSHLDPEAQKLHPCLVVAFSLFSTRKDGCVSKVLPPGRLMLSPHRIIPLMPEILSAKHIIPDHRSPASVPIPRMPMITSPKTRQQPTVRQPSVRILSSNAVLIGFCPKSCTGRKGIQYSVESPVALFKFSSLKHRDWY
ncbi:hypothetical protein QCA50_012419 [Cerrena zonata]|uniref:Uncharacterized protein n=1 Tax=Cerrena zonata TaxID=2478898 RepID=A0AAW0FWB1_9APHY